MAILTRRNPVPSQSPAAPVAEQAVAPAAVTTTPTPAVAAAAALPAGFFGGIPASVAPSVAAAPAPAAAPAVAASSGTAPAVLAARAAAVSQQAPDDFLAGVAKETAMVEMLNAPHVIATVERANPKIGRKALHAAIDYVSNRSNIAAWQNLVGCTHRSIVEAVVKLAAHGLCVSSITGDAFLTPRFSKEEKSNVAVAVPGVRGMEKVIMNSGKVDGVQGNIVRAQDLFVCEEGLNPVLKFVRNMSPDKDQPNPVIGAYSIITSVEGRSPKIKTVAIEEKCIKQGVNEVKSWSVNGKPLNTGYMGIDAAGVYTCQRAAMREVARTWGRDIEGLADLVAMEDLSLQSGEEIPGQQMRIRGGNSRIGVPSVVTAKPTAIAADADVAVAPQPVAAPAHAPQEVEVVELAETAPMRRSGVRVC